MPAIAPRAVPRRQKRPPRKAGAICATAANDRRPIDTRAVSLRQPLVQEAQRQYADNRQAPDPQDERADVALGDLLPADAPPQPDRHDEVVGNGDRQRETVEHHHAGRRRQPADHRHQRHAARARRERKREHRQIAIDRAVRKQIEAGHGERRDEQIDQHEIGGKQPGRGAHAALIVIFDDRHMKLPRQQENGEGREQRGHPPHGGVRRRLDDGGDLRIGQGRLGKSREAAVEAPDDESADGEESPRA